MPEAFAQILVGIVFVYLSVGFVFGVAFVTVGVGRLDPQAKQATFGFRLLILPGTAALWPLLALRWWRRQGPPEEHNAHRDLAQAAGNRRERSP